MESTNQAPALPSDVQRLAACERPPGRGVMYQQWRDLLFLHWSYPVEKIQQTLPEGLFADTFGGNAYLGIVPFFMKGIRPRYCPALPGISDFMELNLRTYVYDSSGVPGVWFYSLDANQWLAVKIARRFFHLPYEHAKMSSSLEAENHIRFVSQRIGPRGNGSTCEFSYGPSEEMRPTAVGSLEFFLVERYRLYSRAPDGLRRGSVFHQPYGLSSSALTAWDEHLIAMNGFTPTRRPPDHVVMSRGVDVTIFPLERVLNRRNTDVSN